MKKLIVCCDGTWQNADAGEVSVPTNVTRITHAINSQTIDGVSQIVYYQSGVGTGASMWDKVVGGGLGVGLSEHVREAYGFLANNYHPGDTIHLFGFSRGAYTARSIGGLIILIGILTKKGMDGFYEIYSDYMAGKLRDPQYAQNLKAREGGSLVTLDVPIHSVGVWDTVGSLGVPELPIPVIGKLISTSSAAEARFHDTNLDKKILHAFQALGLDERRECFGPTLWKRTPDNDVTQMRQCWFPGVHSNIGGGYDDQEIADMTLAWMISCTSHLIEYDERYLLGIVKNPPASDEQWATGKIYNSLTGFMTLAPRKTREPMGYGEGTEETMHVSVRVRMRCMPGWTCDALKKYMWKWVDSEKVWINKDGKRMKEDMMGHIEENLAGPDIVKRLMTEAHVDDAAMSVASAEL